MSKKTLSDGAAAAVQKVRAALVAGLIVVRAAVLKQELDGFVWGDHARNKAGKLYDLQAEKTAAITASYGPDFENVRPFTLTAVLRDGIAKVTEGRHRVFALPDDALVSVNIQDGTNLDAVTIAARSNGEGMGFTLTAAIEQTFAAVMELCSVLPTITDREKQLPALPLPKPGAQRAYTADKDGNPFASHLKSGDAWGPLTYSGDSLAAMLGLSTATVQRVLEILRGLWNADEDPSTVASMGTDTAKTYAAGVSSAAKKIGDAKEKPEQTKTKRDIRAALKAGKTIKNRAGVNITNEPGKLGDAIKDGFVTVEKPAAKVKPEPKTKRTPAQRIAHGMADSVRIAEAEIENEKSAQPTADDLRAIRSALKTIHAYITTSAERAAAADAAKDADATVLPKQSAG